MRPASISWVSAARLWPMASSASRSSCSRFNGLRAQTFCHRGGARSGRYACGGRPVGHQREELIGAETPSSSESHQFLRGGNRHVVADGGGADIEHAAE